MPRTIEEWKMYTAGLASTVEGRFKVAAIILDKRNNLLSQGVNSYVKTHPLQKRYASRVGRNKEFLHAEIAALIKCRNRNRAEKILIVRVGNSGKLLPINPCPVCELAIRTYGIKEVIC